MMMAFTDWSQYIENPPVELIKRIVAVSGIYDLTPIKETYINEPLQLTETEILNNSPLILPIVKAPTCELVFAYGENETNEFKRQSIEMNEKLKHLGQQNPCKEIKGKNHFDVILTLADSDSWLFQHC